MQFGYSAMAFFRPFKTSDLTLGLVLVLALFSGAYWWRAANRPADTKPASQRFDHMLAQLNPLFMQAVTATATNPADSDAFHNHLRAQPPVAMVASAADPWLWPDINHPDKHAAYKLGGCRLDADKWAMLLVDGAALSQLPKRWPTQPVRVCLGRNGSAGPNQLGIDVAWAMLNPTAPDGQQLTLIKKAPKPLPGSGA
ncbi:MAG: hypothetical protein KC462_05930 [Cyanobacteria bacterium HKST-UBA05]|nr:hypothetical protein [Cyanobacteria bacterium HKST-UBA05]